MNKTLYLMGLALLLVNAVLAQNKFSADAQTLYNAKDYVSAGRLFIRAAREDEYSLARSSDYYNAACAYALAGKADSAMALLKLSVRYGFDDPAQIASDSDLASLHSRTDWPAFLAGVHTRPKSTKDPQQVKFVTSDVRKFWKAYDMAQRDTARRYAIYKKQYIDTGTIGLQEYFQFKVGSIGTFIKGHDQRPKFYAAMRRNTFAVDRQKAKMRESFVNFKALYPQAELPNVYFIIGSFSSGGTSAYDGLLIGLDMRVRTLDIPTDELSLWQKNNFTELAYLPNTVAHELIHFNQHLGTDTTLLHAALYEGMADFIGELISGKTSNERLHAWARGREKQIWADFEKEMYLNRARNWIGNSDQETADKPADLGYWAGYQICKAYYKRAADKKQAIADMLSLKDDRAFYERSGAAELFR